MKRFQKIYLEISNVCNLKCSFCPGTRRNPTVMNRDTFSKILPQLRQWSDFLYFHLMGEPLCHPQLDTFLGIAAEHDFKVILTTNGTLLQSRQTMLLSSPALHKVNISLHAFEANDLSVPFETYLENCFTFAKAVEGKKIVVFRLWNHGGAEARNEEILRCLQAFFPEPWEESRKGIRIGDRIFLEYGDKFDWPDLSARDNGERVFCYGLRDQIGILADGRVVPCCLDHEGDLSLGNILEQPLDEILNTPRAQAIYQGFRQRKAAEELCRKCGYAKRFG